MLPDNTVLNTKTVAEILRMGYTRIPVYSEDRNNVISLLFVKDLALLDPDDNFTVKTVCGYHEHALRFVMKDTPLRVMLEEFKKVFKFLFLFIFYRAIIIWQWYNKSSNIIV